jgi:hypothetical protein
MNNKIFKKVILIVAVSLVLSIAIAYNVYVPSMKNTTFGNINIAVPKEYNCNETETGTNLLSHMTFSSADNKTSIIYQCYKTSEMTNIERKMTEENIVTIKNNMIKDGNVDCEKINEINVLTDADRKLLLFERNDNIYLVSIDTTSKFVSDIIAKKIIKSIY